MLSGLIMNGQCLFSVAGQQLAKRCVSERYRGWPAVGYPAECKASASVSGRGEGTVLEDLAQKNFCSFVGRVGEKMFG